MKKKETNKQKDSLSHFKKEKPKVYVVRRGNKGWEISRRSFLSGAAATGAALANAGFTRGVTAQGRIFRLETDVDVNCEKVKAHLDSVASMVISQNGKFLFTGSFDEAMKLWSLELWSLSETFEEHTGDVATLDISPNGKWLVSGSYDKTVKVWSVRKKKGALKVKPRNIFKEHKDLVKEAIVTPDSKHVVSAGMNGKIMLWSLPGCKLIKSWSTNGSIYSMAVSPDGKLMATGGFGCFKLWSLEMGNEGVLLRNFECSIYFIHALAFSPDSKWLVSGSYGDEYLKIWSMPDGNLYKAVKGSKVVSEIAISHDGKYIATAGWNDCVRIRSFPSGDFIKVFGSNSTNVGCLAFSPDDKLLVVGYGEEDAVKIWKFPKGKLMHCLIDLEANKKDKHGIKYKYRGANGRWIRVTVPACKCAPPMPKGAVCICNTVPGSYCGCVGHTCSCVGHCACQGHFHYWYPN